MALGPAEEALCGVVARGVCGAEDEEGDGAEGEEAWLLPEEQNWKKPRSVLTADCLLHTNSIDVTHRDSTLGVAIIPIFRGESHRRGVGELDVGRGSSGGLGRQGSRREQQGILILGILKKRRILQ